jgi:hypothetical protein
MIEYVTHYKSGMISASAYQRDRLRKIGEITGTNRYVDQVELALQALEKLLEIELNPDPTKYGLPDLQTILDNLNQRDED